jgi:hypothetical protein
MSYEVLDPTKVHFGKTYSSFAEEWFNWFLAADADKRVSGQVVFLRSAGLPYDITKPDGSGFQRDLSVSTTYAGDEYYPRPYQNEPNVRVGRDKLQICINQAIFVPIIVSYSEASKPYIDFGMMQDYTGLTIDYGDNPPRGDQLSIDGVDIKLPRGRDMREFRVASPVFTAVVPDVDYGRSIKDFLEMDLSSGHHPTIVDGYFFLIRFTEPGTYTVYSYASAPRETRGGSYFSELLYQVQVQDCGPKESKGHPGVRSDKSAGLIRRILRDKVKSGELLRDEAKDLMVKAKIAANVTEANDLLTQ